MDRKEAIEVVRKNWPYSGYTMLCEALETLIPELAESEDEKIRKSLLSYLHGLGELEYPDKTTYNKWLAWLEKQDKTNPYSGASFEYNGHTWGMCARDNGVDISLDGQLFKHLEERGEKKSTNTKTKFHEGDWVVHNGVGAYKIIEVRESWYEVISYNNEIGIQYSIGFDKEKDCRLWTINDAKNGDVLVHGEQLFLFKRMNTSNSFYAHCNYHFTGYDNLSFSDCSYSIDNIHPATKEQRVRLEKEITKAGYRWNKEERKLEKI